MVSSISLGNFYSANGRTVVGSAGGSGLDTQSLVEALVKARSFQLTKLEDKVEANTKIATARTDLKNLLTKFKDATDLLRNVPGFGKASSNAFDYSTASVASNTDVSGSSYLSVLAEPGTLAQSFKISDITSIARAKIQTTGSFAVADGDTAAVKTTPGTGELGAGTITLTTSTGTANITLADGDTLNQVASKFNAVKGSTGVSASVVKVAANSYKIQFSATKTGTDADFTMANGGGNVTGDTNVFSQITFGQLQGAANAEFEFNGEAITRQSNSITDIIKGVTINILKTTPDADTELDVNVQPDTGAAKNAIVNFMNAYNDLRIFAAKQSETKDDGTLAEDSLLSTDPTLRSAIASMSTEVNKAVAGIDSGLISRLADIGITTTDLQATDENPFVRNILTLDETKLDSALSGKFDQVRSLFEFRLTSDNPNLAVYTRTNALSISDFSLNVNTSGGIYQATYTDAGGSHTINLTATAITGGYRLEGQKGTALEGLVLLYASTSSATINVNVTQGVADRLNNFVGTTLLDASTGMLTVDQNALATDTTRLNEEITRQNDTITRYREQLLAKFGAMEAAIASINTLLTSLDAQARARDNAS